MTGERLEARAGRRERAWARGGDLAVPALDALVEGAWIALVYASIQVGLAHGPAVLGPLAFALAAGAGIAWSRGARGAAARPWVGAALALCVGAAGWLADPAVRGALLEALGGGGDARNLEAALTTNAAGWLLGFAVVRGVAHRERERDEETAGRLLGRILLLAIPWAIGLAFGQASRDAFIAQALVATVVFAAAGLLAVGLGRLETLGAAAGVDWRSNRAWVAVVVLVVALVLLVSVPAAFLVGVTPGALLDAAWIPLGTIAGVLGIAIAAIATPILSGVDALIRILPTPAPTPAPTAAVSLAPGGGLVPPSEGDARVGLTLTILALVALAVAVVVVVSRIRAGAARAPAVRGGLLPAEERSIEAPRLTVRLPALRLPIRRRAPTTAPAAYLALLEDLEGDPTLARRPAESPRGHARRLAGRPGARPAAGPAAGGPGSGSASPSPWSDPAVRIVAVGTGVIGPDWRDPTASARTRVADDAARRRAADAQRAASGAPAGAPTTPAASDPGTRRDLGLLVADWELARYGARILTPGEDARGVARWRRLRRALRTRPPAEDTGR